MNMRVNPIGSINTNYKIYQNLSSGKKINKAADDAASLAIAQKLLREEKGLNVGSYNARDGIGVLNVADGALNSITDSLNRMYELGVRAMNGLYSDSDRASMQKEIDGLKEDIESTAKNTSLNEQKLLDGSMADMHIATNPNGGGMEIRMQNTTLSALGIANFDVTGDFNLDDISNALDKVSAARSEMGASTNRLEHTYNHNMQASENILSSRSRLEDLDIAKAITEKQKNDLLVQYRTMMLSKIMSADAQVLNLFQ